MRGVSIGAAGFLIGLTVIASQTLAFGDRCHRPVKETGEASTMRGAMEEAKKCWEGDVRGNFGARAANWYYSADRSMSCSWNATNTWFKCTTIATPCERVR